jgi:peptidyl-prolyl cis-trans isomerase D
MISWVQRNFQQHFRIIFTVVLVGTIVSFVVTIGATSGIGYGDRRTATQDFFGHNLGSPGELNQLIRDAGISVELQAGYNSLSEDQLKEYAFQRVAALHLADTLHLPAAPTEEQVTDYIRGLRIFMGQDGQFDANRYNTFRNSLDRNAGADPSIGRVLTEDARINEVGRLLNGPGYVLDADVKREMSREDTTWTLATATVDYASFNPAIHPTEADLAKFFSENSFRYDIPPRVVVRYVDFPAADYLAGVTVTDAEIRAYYDANPGRFTPAPASPISKPIDPKSPKSFVAARPQVEAALKFKQAQRLALDAASKFALSLYDNKVAAGPALDAYLAQSKLRAKPVAPFTHQAGPSEFAGSPEIADAAFKLGPDRYFSEELPVPDGAAVLLWQETRPTEHPLLPEVRSKVLADYLDNEKHVRFAELGRMLQSRIETELKSGASFERAAAIAGGAAITVEAKTLPPFTLRSRPKDVGDSIAGALDHLEKGQVSEMITTADKGLLVYAIDKRAPDLRRTNPYFIETRAAIASYSARLGTSAYLGEIVERELKRSEAAVK